MSYQQVIVVEGYHDEQKIKSVYPDIECIVTNGSEISRETLNLIYETSLLKEVILFLDPDYPGKRITQKIMETQGKFKIAYIDKEKALNNSKTKVGIEHAKNKDIIEALERLLTIEYNLKTVVRKDIYVRNLIDNTNSKELRKFVCQKLNIPFCNGKTFLKYLNLLSIDLERIDQIINEKQS